MDQLLSLLKYQEADLEVDEYEMKLKKSPLRQKLVKLRNYLMSAQSKLDELETELDDLTKRMADIKADVAQVSQKKKLISKASEEVDTNNLEAVRELIQKNDRLLDDIDYYENLLSKARDEATDMNEKQHDIVSKALKAKSDYTQMKAVYDEQFKQSSEALEELKKKRSEMAKPLDQKLLERYAHVKSHRSPPLALLSNDQCMGCNMSLPSVVTRSAQAGGIIECENCGRILYIGE